MLALVFDHCDRLDTDSVAEPAGWFQGPAAATWIDALLIGLAQMFAPLPG